MTKKKARDPNDMDLYALHYQRFHQMDKADQYQVNILFNKYFIETRDAEHVMLERAINQVECGSLVPVVMSDGAAEYEDIMAAQELINGD